MKAFLQQNGGEWYDDFVYISKEPLKRLGFEIYPFDSDDLENTLLCYPLDISNDVIIGSVEATTAFFEGCGIVTPDYLGYPEQLKKFLGRKINEVEFGELKNYELPYFIKPSKGVKKFTGCLIERESSLKYLREIDDVLDTDKVLMSEPLNFVSEYRCFVHEEKLMGIHYYSGDFKVFPDINVIEEMVKVYTDANCAYTLDIGVTDEGKTILVEINDMWAIGSYGFDSRTYAIMCVRRMREIGRQFYGETELLWKRILR